MKPFRYFKPKTAEEALSKMATDPNAKYIAGGTNITDLMKRGIEVPDLLIDISQLPFNRIEEKGTVLRIGALALNSAVADNSIVIEKIPLLAQALNAGASGQIRNMATVGGNLLQKTRCDYYYDTTFPCNKRNPGSGCAALKGINRSHAIFGVSEKTNETACIAVHPSDMAVAMMALDAAVVLQNSKGERRVSISDLYKSMAVNPHEEYVMRREELIVAIEIPKSAYYSNAHYLKVRDRASFAFGIVSVAATLDISQNRVKSVGIALGGVAHKPWRLPAVEKLMIGQPVSDALFQKVAGNMMKDAFAFEHNAYKIKLASNAIVHALKTAAEIP